MPRDVRVQLEDILEACKRISSYTAELSFEQFVPIKKRLTQSSATSRSSEKGRRRSLDVRKLIAVDWKRVSGLRDVLIHEYFGIDIEIVWGIMQTEVPDRVGSRISASRLRPTVGARLSSKGVREHLGIKAIPVALEALFRIVFSFELQELDKLRISSFGLLARRPMVIRQ